MSYELKEFVLDANFIEQMNKAFADLRADYELDLDTRKDQIKELKSVHVDFNSYLSNLTSYSTKSSGLLSGLRGTGKSHLLLLARNEINDNFHEKKCLCFYINVKRLHLPESFSQEIFNRVFSAYLYGEISKQLSSLLIEQSPTSYLDKWLTLFNKDKKALIAGIASVIGSISRYQEIALEGSTALRNLDKSELSLETINKEILELTSKICSTIGIKDQSLSSELQAKINEELSNKLNIKTNLYSYLNIDDVRTNLIQIIKILNIKSITFYIDEWEKLYSTISAQEYLSFYIDKVNDHPFYFWIGAVPHRGKFYHLDIGADLQHKIDLDTALVFENSDEDKRSCIEYFKQFINKRLSYYLSQYHVDYSVLFNQPKKLEMLVYGSMANPRDFGTMVLQCWTDYKNYRVTGKYHGRPFKYINEPMIQNSIKSDGGKKLTNIKGNKDLLSVWQDVESFALSKKSSHIAIIDSTENIEILSTGHFSELLYHRLLHYRKGHVSQKESHQDEKMGIYALNYACTYDYHQKEKRMNFITKYEDVHNKVRRYIYEPSIIINKLRIASGEIHPCVSCGEKISVIKMKAAWERNSCPFCGERIYKS